MLWGVVWTGAGLCGGEVLMAVLTGRLGGVLLWLMCELRCLFVGSEQNFVPLFTFFTQPHVVTRQCPHCRSAAPPRALASHFRLDMTERKSRETPSRLGRPATGRGQTPMARRQTRMARRTVLRRLWP